MASLPKHIHGMHPGHIEQDRKAYEFLRKFIGFESFQHTDDGGIEVSMDTLGIKESTGSTLVVEIDQAFRDDARMHHASAHVRFINAPEPV